MGIHTTPFGQYRLGTGSHICVREFGNCIFTKYSVTRCHTINRLSENVEIIDENSEKTHDY